MENPKRHPALKDTACKTILDSITDGVFTVDRNWRISSWNKADEHIKTTLIRKMKKLGISYPAPTSQVVAILLLFRSLQ